MGGTPMKQLSWLLIVWIGLATLSVSAQAQPFVGVVRVESAFARALPAFDAPESASVFETERLEIVSRNLDGTWFEARRPGRMNTLGWVWNGVIDWDFLPEQLPLGDFVTGVIGPSPLTQSTDFAVYINEGVYLREQPLRASRALLELPPLITIPVLGRNQDGSWLFVNYLGQQGWMIAFAGRPVPNVLNIPMPPNLPPLETPAFEVIPVELQQAQIDRLRVYIHERYALAAGLEAFWWRVFRGEIMPCSAPPELTYYPYTDEDVRQLPELGRYAPSLISAINYLNRAREPLLTCGVVSPETTLAARNAAINARVVFDATLERLDILEETVVQARR